MSVFSSYGRAHVGLFVWWLRHTELRSAAAKILLSPEKQNILSSTRTGTPPFMVHGFARKRIFHGNCMFQWTYMFVQSIVSMHFVQRCNSIPGLSLLFYTIPINSLVFSFCMYVYIIRVI